MDNSLAIFELNGPVTASQAVACLIDAGLDPNVLIDALAYMGLSGARWEPPHFRGPVDHAAISEDQLPTDIKMWLADAMAAVIAAGGEPDVANRRELLSFLVGCQLLNIARFALAPLPMSLSDNPRDRVAAKIAVSHQIPIAPAGDTTGLPSPALLAALAARRNPLPPSWVPTAVGLSADLDSGAICRASLTAQADDAPIREQMTVIETNIDDMNPQFYEILVDRLLAAGARDVWTTPIGMKKSRPAVMLSALSRPADTDALVEILITRSTTLGVRTHLVDRISADRRMEAVETRSGRVRLKLKIWRGRVIDVAPEYDDCAALARATDTAISEIWSEARTIGQVFVGRRATAGPQPDLIRPGGA